MSYTAFLYDARFDLVTTLALPEPLPVVYLPGRLVEILWEPQSLGPITPREIPRRTFYLMHQTGLQLSYSETYPDGNAHASSPGLVPDYDASTSSIETWELAVMAMIAEARRRRAFRE